MFYSQVSVQVIRSAKSTLAICGRQAVKDTIKVVEFGGWLAEALTSKEAIRTYRMIWKAAVIASMVAVSLGWSARDLVRWFVAQQQSAVVVDAVEESKEAEAQPEVQAVVEDAGESIQSVVDAPTVQAPSQVPSIRELKQMARGVIVGYGTLTKGELIQQLQAKGVLKLA